ncbi:putative signal peptide protein [Puccinia sorghi]|uniref:Putative signal peptide protein n=1 Tax=Puccinia sorghi TaxID=27349 RepID=A0A0L6V5Q3_9BASI|nr:putative signal peptide protein [Puccinia sorghi]
MCQDSKTTRHLILILTISDFFNLINRWLMGVALRCWWHCVDGKLRQLENKGNYFQILCCYEWKISFAFVSGGKVISESDSRNKTGEKVVVVIRGFWGLEEHNRLRSPRGLGLGSRKQADSGATELGQCSREWKSMAARMGNQRCRNQWNAGNHVCGNQWKAGANGIWVAGGVKLWLGGGAVGSIYVDRVRISRKYSKLQITQGKDSKSLSGLQEAKGVSIIIRVKGFTNSFTQFFCNETKEKLVQIEGKLSVKQLHGFFFPHCLDTQYNLVWLDLIWIHKLTESSFTQERKFLRHCGLQDFNSGSSKIITTIISRQPKELIKLKIIKNLFTIISLKSIKLFSGSIYSHK